MNVKGLITEIPEKLKLNARSMTILYTLEQCHAVQFQTDDGPDDRETLTQLKTVAKHTDYDLVSFTKHHHILLNSDEIPEV